MKNMKTNKIHEYVKVRSIINGDEYYTSKSFPTKDIEGIQYIRVLKNLEDPRMLFMNKEKIEFIKN